MKLRGIRKPTGGFTLLEIIGVVALIAILAAVLAPRVTSVIGRGKVNSTVQSLAGLKTATMDYIAANSALPIRAGKGNNDAANVDGRFDVDLRSGGFIEKLFSCPIGSQVVDGSLAGRTHLRALNAVVSKSVGSPKPDNAGSNFNLDRDTTTADFNKGQVVVSAYIPGVPLADAVALNKQLDGDLNTTTKADVLGRCIYSTPDSSGRVTVSVYIAHY